jgi:DNA-binding CsgD family transcriptional regulator
MSGTVVGREDELSALTAFVEAISSGRSALLLEGEPGIGKTTLCEAAVAIARERSYRVLACRPSSNDTPLSFAALGDLLQPVLPDALDGLPSPQRRAIEVALLLEESDGRSAGQRAIAVALLGILRSLASVGPVLVAVDDAQWLDRETALTLEFAVRRLVDEPVGLLVAHRPDVCRLADDLERGLPAATLRRLRVGSLSIGALHRLLRARLGLGLPRPTLLRVHEATGGNPFYALEIARALPVDRLLPGEPLPVPGTLTELLLVRVRSLPAPVRSLLLVASLLSDPTVDLLDAAEAGGSAVAAALEAAIAAGVLGSDGRRVWFTHPLLRETVFAEAVPRRRRHVHARLAAVVTDGEQRARHLALATVGPDPEVASTLERAAHDAAARGAPAAAAELSELAIERTPAADRDERRRRTLAAGEYYLTAGALSRGRALLEALLAELPAGRERADALLCLAARGGNDTRTNIDLAERALRDAAGDPRRLARIETRLSTFCSPDGAGPSFAHARRAVARAEQSGDARLLGLCLSRLALWETFAARPTHGVLDRALALGQEGFDAWVYDRPQMVLGVLRTFQGRLTEARALLRAELAGRAAHADEQGCVEIHCRLAEADWHAGAWAEAAEHARSACELAEQIGLGGRGDEDAQFVEAFIAAHRGEVVEARAAAEAGIALVRQQDGTLIRLGHVGVIGLLEFLAGNVAQSVSYLGPVLERMLGSGWALATEWLSPYALEALIAAGDLDRARPLVTQLEDEGTRLGSAWVAGLARRLRASLVAAEGDTTAALALLDETLAWPGSRGWPFERGRTLLALGVLQRRVKRKRAARESLQASLALFEELGAKPWAAMTSAELSRVGGRGPSAGGLTPTERRVASLVAEGRSNREVAAALFVAPRTVEWNLSKIYAKLGVRSRAELAHRWTSGPPAP